jgi:hypothetical protein
MVWNSYDEVSVHPYGWHVDTIGVSSTQNKKRKLCLGFVESMLTRSLSRELLLKSDKVNQRLSFDWFSNIGSL